MAIFSSKPIKVNQSAEALAEKMSDFTRLQSRIDSLPEEQRAAVGDLRLTPDSIVLSTPQVGEITLKVVERTPRRMVLNAVGSPVPMSLKLDITPAGDDASELVAAMDVDVPVFLKPIIGGTMQKAVDRFAELFQSLA